MDLRLKFFPDLRDFDLDLKTNELEFDDGLETAVLVSLFTDGRVDVDELPSEKKSKRGWWGDGVVNDEKKLTGSKLWVLSREKTTDETLEAAKQYCEDALQWLIDDGIAEGVDVETSYLDRERMSIKINIQRPSVEESRRFDYVWEARTNGIQSTNA